MTSLSSTVLLTIARGPCISPGSARPMFTSHQIKIIVLLEIYFELPMPILELHIFIVHDLEPLAPLLTPNANLASTSNQPAEYTRSDRSCQVARVKCTTSQIRSLAEFITSRESKGVRYCKTQGNDWPILAKNPCLSFHHRCLSSSDSNILFKPCQPL